MASGCSPNPVPYDANCQQYLGCAAGKKVLICLHGGGHDIPSFGGSEVWSFFQTFQ
jgi:hypothetical protein